MGFFFQEKKTGSKINNMLTVINSEWLEYDDGYSHLLDFSIFKMPKFSKKERKNDPWKWGRNGEDGE